MATCAVPVSWDGLGVERCHNTKIFADTMQDEARHPQMITHVNPLTWSNLKLPLEHTSKQSFHNSAGKTRQTLKHILGSYYYLGRHHFCICSTDVDASIQTCSVMSLYNISAIGFVSSNSTVIWTYKNIKKSVLKNIQCSLHADRTKQTTCSPCGPGNPLDGQPKGCPSVPSMVYSCSIPNQGCWSLTISITLLHVMRRLVSAERKLGWANYSTFTFTQFKQHLKTELLNVGSSKYKKINFVQVSLNTFVIIIQAY